MSKEVASEELERLFKDDIREKKIAGYGVHHRASRKKGFKGGVHFPVDLMSAKEKKEYTKAGEVKKYFMDEKDISYVKSVAEIEAMGLEAAKEYLSRIKQFHTCKKLRTHWGFESDYYLYKLYKKFNVPINTDRTKRAADYIAKRAIEELNKDKKAASAAASGVDNQELKKEVKPESKDEPKEKNSMSLTLSGVYDGKEGGDKILALASLMSAGAKYKVFLTITE